MAWMQRGMLAAVVVLGGLVVKSRVGGSASDGLEPAKSPIKGAVYAAQVPVYPGAKFEDEMGGNYYDDVGGPITFVSHSWFFEVADPVEKVIDFYSAKLPREARRIEAEAGEAVFEWQPPGSKSGEEVTIRISEGRLQIGEVVTAASGG